MKQLSQIYTVLLLVTFLSGCTTISYYTQAIRGHLALTMAGEPVDRFIASKGIPDELRNKLILSRQARRFASERLGLPTGDAFTAYVILDRPWVVVNLVAVPEFSLQPHQWCYPVLGCQAYRGYFHLADARQEERRFRTQGYDTFIGGVTAYSTLGWFDDPLHSGFTNLADDRMVALMFHELAHQGDPSAFGEALTHLELRNRTHALVVTASADLEQLYQQKGVLSESRLRERKQLIFEELNAAYERLPANGSEGPFGAPPVAFNNARIALFTQYNQYVPAFRQLLKQSSYDFPMFYRAVESLSRQPEEQRQQALQELSERFEENL